MSNTLTITLKQHTPIIHFQHAQPGATLRATEVKPKLDRFVRENFKRLFTDKDDVFLYEKLEFFEASEKRQAAYKIDIQPSGAENLHKIFINALLKRDFIGLLDEHGKEFLHGTSFFAQENENKKIFPQIDTTTNDRNETVPVYGFDEKAFDCIPKMGLMDYGEITIRVFSWDKDVRKIIEKIAPYFFAYENFGTRQSKGFGCFSVTNLNAEPMDKMIVKLFPVFARKTTIRTFPDDTDISFLQRAMTTIQSDYKLLKSGRSAREDKNRQYRKSLLFSYAVTRSQPIRWEKRKLKIAINAKKFHYNNRQVNLQVDRNNGKPPIYDDAGTTHWNETSTDHYEFVRAILGLAEQYEFLTDHGNNIKYVAKVKSISGDVQRCKSPIRFKLIDDQLYLLAEEVDSKMLKEQFNFDIQLKIKDKISTDASHKMVLPKPLSFPATLKMKDFLNYAMGKGNGILSNYKTL